MGFLRTEDTIALPSLNRQVQAGRRTRDVGLACRKQRLWHQCRLTNPPHPTPQGTTPEPATAPPGPAAPPSAPASVPDKLGHVRASLALGYGRLMSPRATTSRRLISASPPCGPSVHHASFVGLRPSPLFSVPRKAGKDASPRSWPCLSRYTYRITPQLPFFKSYYCLFLFRE